MIENKLACDSQTKTIPAPLSVRQMPPRPKLLLRGRTTNRLFTAAVEEAAGIPLPALPNSAAGIDPELLWLSPTGWLVLGTEETLNTLANELRSRLEGRDGDVIEVGDEYTHFRVQGDASADLLATCCPFDLSLPAFSTGTVARTLVAGVASIVHKSSAADGLDLYVDRSYAHYLLDALQAQMREFA